jgi:hypothetical protein
MRLYVKKQLRRRTRTMTTDMAMTPSLGAGVGELVQITAHHRSTKHLGYWTTSRHFHVRASSSLVVLDLLLARIDPGDIEIHLDIDHATVKLLVPDGARIDDDDLRCVGRGRVKDWTGTSAPGGRQIHLLGEMRDAEIRVHRGGVALLSLLCSPRHVRDVQMAHNEGRLGYLHNVHEEGPQGRPPLSEGDRR